MKEEVEKFIARIDRLEKRYNGDKYATAWLVPKEELIAVRDSITKPTLFENETIDKETN